MKWRCGVCGYVHDGAQAPEKCPKCGAPREKFIRIDEDAAALIEKSRHTNSLWTQVAGLAETLEEIADDGLDDALDPPCVQLFEKTKKAAIELRQGAKAEIQSHIQKGKWG